MLVFIFPPEQIDPHKNAFFSHPAVQFMCESLQELGGSIIQFYKGDIVATLGAIRSTYKFGRLYQNEDYSVYARKRDATIQSWCTKHAVEFIQTEDYGLFSLREGLVPDTDRPYTILAQFYKRYLKDLQVRKPVPFSYASKIWTPPRRQRANVDLGSLYIQNPNLAQRGGRSHALAIMKTLRTKFDTYKDTRDFPADEQGTTRISAHLKFGTVSVREFYWACVKAFGTRDHPLIREIMFREFYMKIYALRPELQRGTAFLSRLDAHVPWKYDKKLAEAWKTGHTGFPLVDAGMRQLAATGWCHNRVRMLVASVATKYLLLDWRDCAQFFYTKLVDADTFSNTAGWGWASSTGVDATLYFRAPFNPFIQSKKFDKDAVYIKRWVPELRDVAPKDIHSWHNPAVRERYATSTSPPYPAPIIDHKEASARALEVFKRAAKI
jgi:deoxyribodipyrimidine photo-lyase